MKAPAVSVVLVAYNAEKHVAATLRSLADQEFQDFELIVVDNASTDSTRSIVSSWGGPRLRIVDRLENGGPQAANDALPLASGKYIARIDADDLAARDRLAVQFRYLEAHPECSVCAGDYDLIREDGTPFGENLSPHDPDEIRWKLGWINFICHSTVMMRTADVRAEDGYDPSLWCAQDYDLILRLLAKGDVVVLPQKLAQYRVYEQSITYRRQEQMFRESRLTTTRHLRRSLGEEIPEGAAHTAISIMRDEPPPAEPDWPGALGLIRSYTRACTVSSRPAARSVIRRDTAKQLVRYGRRVAGSARIQRMPFEATALIMSPRQWARR